MNDNLNNFGKTVISIHDALLSAGIDPEGEIGCLEAPDALFFYSADDANADDRIYQLVAEIISDEQLAAFKDELEAAIADFNDGMGGERLIEDFVEASMMMGSSPEEMTDDVAKIMDALRNGKEIEIPRMEDTWYADGAHGS